MKDFKTLRTFFNPVEAEILKTRLDAAGIPAVVNGAEVATMLSHIGVAVARVKVEVLPEHIDLAYDILQEDDRLREERSAWTCAACKEFNEAAFELCWNCSKQRDDQDAIGEPPEAAKTTIVNAAVLPPEANESIVVQDLGQRPRSGGSPYQAPSDLAPNQLRKREPKKQTSPIPECDEETVALVKRAFTGAVLSPLVLPPLLSIYVTYLLLKVPLYVYRVPEMRYRLVITWLMLVVSYAVAWAVFPFPVLVQG